MKKGRGRKGVSVCGSPLGGNQTKKEGRSKPGGGSGGGGEKRGKRK